MKWREQVNRLLQKAEMDITAVEELLGSTRVSDSIIGFHLQQAVEKLLKALLAANDIRYRKTHDIRELLDLLEDREILVPEELVDLDDYTPYAVEFRYEDISYEQETLDRTEAMKKIKMLDNWVREQLRNAS
jgi:HEPN domain-containing protein